MENIMGNVFYFDFEVIFMEFLQNILGKTGAAIISFFSAFGEEMLLVAILGFIYWCYDKKLGMYVGTSLLVGCVFNPMIKNVFNRRRPYFDNPQIKCLRPVDKSTDIYDIAAQGYSFPSNHSTNSVTVYGQVAKQKKNKIMNVVAIAAPILIGLSRITVGVHYPTDVLVGWLLGLVVVLVVSFIYGKVDEEKWWIVHICIFAVGCTGFFYCKTDDYYTSIGLIGGFFLSWAFDKKFVNFKNTRLPVRCILRVLVGGFIFFAMTKITKMPFSSAFLESGSLLSHLARALRYMISLFAATGLYPAVFAKLDKFWKEEA